jgi:hypothetical protein
LSFCLVSKDYTTKPGSVKFAAGRKDVLTKILDDPAKSDRSRLDNFARRLVRVKDMTPKFAQNIDDERLSDGDGTCKTDL